MTRAIIPFLYFSLSLSSSHGQNNFLNEFQWENRVLLIFSSDTVNSFYEEQFQSFHSEVDEYLDRNLRVFTILEESILNERLKKIEPTTLKLRDQYSIQENDFAVILIGKDGGEKLRSSKPVTNEELFSTIDAMPMRRSEMRVKQKSHR